MTQPPPPPPAGPPPGQPAPGMPGQPAGGLPPSGLTPEKLAEMSRQVPPAVAQAANGRGFGELLNGRKNLPLTSALIGFGAFVAGILVLFGLSALSAADDSGWARVFLRPIGLGICVAGVGGLAYAIRVLVTGPVHAYLYRGGLVASHRTTLTVLAWPEIAAMTPRLGTRGNAKGKVLGYDVRARTGTSALIPATGNRSDPHDAAFTDQLAFLVRQAGGQVG